MDLTNGVAAIVCFPGVMYRGGAEQKIRKYLIDNNYVEQEDTREKIDIVKLNAEIKEIVAREEELRAEIDKNIAEIEEDKE